MNPLPGVMSFAALALFVTAPITQLLAAGLPLSVIESVVVVEELFPVAPTGVACCPLISITANCFRFRFPENVAVNVPLPGEAGMTAVQMDTPA